MKKLIILTAAVLCTLSAALGQARKPTIMVVPSDVWCTKNNFMQDFDNQGTIQKVPDYKKALQTNSDVRLLITKLGGLMAQYDFPLKTLEQEMKNLENEQIEMSLLTGRDTGSAIAESPIEQLNRVAKADIIIDLDYTIKNVGGRKQITFIVSAIDAYSSKMISGNTGVSSLSTVSPDVLLEEVVLSFIHNFTTDLQRHFNDMFENGREVKVTMVRFDSCPFDFSDDFQYNGQWAPLSDIINVWFEDNAVEGRYSNPFTSNNLMRFDQVRMPLYGQSLSGREVAIDTQGFVRSLVNMFRADPYNVPVKVYPKGLGEVWLVVGEK